MPSNDERKYIAIDLKSFYASVECVERGLDPMKTNLVVADSERTEKTICLAVSPALKDYGISGRARLFEVIQKVKEVNKKRLESLADRKFVGESYDDDQLSQNHALAVSYIIAKPRMAYYIEYSTGIYQIYLKYAAPEDIHVYSIDEVFIDVTGYLKTYGMTARELTEKIVRDIYETTGITATAGIGTNLYLCKIAMDIVAKHTEPDKHGVRIAELDEMSYRLLLWDHRPLTDFWRVGKGIAKKLESHGMYTMGDVARCSVGKNSDNQNEELLYKMFGINAELLIDHAWGWEPCTIEQIKAYRPENNSICSGQVLSCPYDNKKAGLVVREMADMLSLDLVEKGLVTDQLVMTIGYAALDRNTEYNGEYTIDRYGRRMPKHGHGTENLSEYTASSLLITDSAYELYKRITNKDLMVHRITITANHVIFEKDIPVEESFDQLDLFTDYEIAEEDTIKRRTYLEREKKRQKAILEIKKRFGKNAIIKGMNLQEGATAMDRNNKIGGHKA